MIYCIHSNDLFIIPLSTSIARHNGIDNRQLLHVGRLLSFHVTNYGDIYVHASITKFISFD